MDPGKIAFIQGKIDRPLVLVGMMGCGKTTLGRVLAKTLELDFTDLDDRIVQDTGQAPRAIFEQHGEPFFRRAETAALKALLGEGAGVIATGGGAVMTPENADMIFSRSCSLWLHAGLDLTIRRIGDIGSRPVLHGGDPAETLRRLMDQRYPVYARADITVENEDVSVEATLERIINALYEYLS